MDNTSNESTNTNESTQDRNWRQLEKAKQEADTAAEAWKRQAISATVKASGVQAPDKLLGLVLEKFETSIADPDDVTPENFLTFANDFGITGLSGGSGEEGDDAGPTPEQQAVANSQSAADRLAAETSSNQPEDASDRIANAEKAGDFQSAFNLKMQSMSR